MSDYMTLGGPMPPSIGRCADLYHDIRDVRLAMQKQVEAIEAREREVKNHIIDNLSKSIDTGAAGLRYRAQIVTKTKYVVSRAEGVDGWGVLFSWIRKNDAFHMLQKRLNDKAVEDWVAENGRELPGTERFNAVDVSITKI